jgi:hypothetical protein
VLRTCPVEQGVCSVFNGKPNARAAAPNGPYSKGVRTPFHVLAGPGCIKAIWLEYAVWNVAGCGESVSAGDTSRRQTGTHAKVRTATIATVRSMGGWNAPVYSGALRMGVSIAQRTYAGNVNARRQPAPTSTTYA